MSQPPARPARPTADPAGDRTTRQGGRAALVVVAGIPGAGKSTALRQLVRAHLLDDAQVVDADAIRRWLAVRLPRVPYAVLRPLVHSTHWARIVVLTFADARPLVVHDTATRARSRAALLTLARLARRPARMLWIDTDPLLARQGQVARGRVLGQATFERHVRRVRRCHPVQAVDARWDLVERTDRSGAADAILATVGTVTAAGR
jgi:hypothetical protein